MTVARPDSGFTLIELLAAFAIAAVAMVAAFDAMRTGAQQEAKAARHVEALLTARSLVDEVSADPVAWTDRRTGRLAGDAVWRLDLRPLEGEAPGETLPAYALALRVEERGRLVFVLHTVVLGN